MSALPSAGLRRAVGRKVREPDLAGQVLVVDAIEDSVAALRRPADV
jgi:hypothetical protein